MNAFIALDVSSYALCHLRDSELQSLQTPELRLTIDPVFGGRVVELVDLRSNRNWLVPDTNRSLLPTDSYQAFAQGWDECFPTLVASDGSALGWSGHLRDHGLLWGVQTETSLSDGQITTIWEGLNYRFKREIAADGARLEVRYTVKNTGTAEFNYLYSQHMLIAACPGEVITLGSVRKVFDRPHKDQFAWPIDELVTVQGLAAGVARKLYADVEGPIRASIGGRHGAIVLDWHGKDLPGLGLWVDYGGWPDDDPVHQVAIEPTTDTRDAPGAGVSRQLAVGDGHDWSIHVTLVPPQQV